jgi:class 3 adenylate cyclase
MPFGKRRIQIHSLLIMSSIVLLVTAVAFWSLYQGVFDRTKIELSELAKSHARLIEAVAKFDAMHTAAGRSSRADTLSQIREAHNRYRGFGESGEIVLIEKHGGLIHFLLPEPKLGFKVPPPIPNDGKVAVPASLVLSGKSGIVRAKDFSGTDVLAAYEYLPFLDMGVVAKMDMAEIRSPFFNVALFTGVLALVSLAVGMLLHSKVVDPMLSEIFNANEELKVREGKLSTLSRQLSKYLSPQVYKSLFEGKASAVTFAHRKKLTIFFSDIVGFTSIANSLEPEDLIRLLNGYLNHMAELVIKHGGTLDKFIGDAALVFFGDPESRGEKEDALACIEMALEMQQAVHDHSQEMQSLGICKQLEVRMGITTGFCTVGNFGSDSRMEYTIVGNQVNLASRFETNCPPGKILISEETYLLVKSHFSCEEQPPLLVKGFSGPVKNYLVIDRLRQDQQAEVIEATGKGFSVKIDPSKLDPSERERALQSVTRALDALKSRS